MQWDIVEDRRDALFPEVGDELAPLLEVRTFEIEHVGIVRAAGRNRGKLQPACRLNRRELVAIEPPGLQAVGIYLVGYLQLRPQVGRVEVALQVGASPIHPGIPIHLPAEEALTISALLANDLGAVDVLGVVDDECPALTHGIVLGLVERIAAEVAKRAKGPAPVRAHDALGGVLHDHEVVPARNPDDLVHLTRDTRVVDRHDHPGPLGDGMLDLGLVQVEGVRADVYEHECRSLGHERGRRGREGKARQDDLITRPQSTERRRHLEGRSATSGEERLLGTKALLHPGVALTREGSVPTDLAIDLCRLAHVAHLGTDVGRNVEVDHRESNPGSSWRVTAYTIA